MLLRRTASVLASHLHTLALIGGVARTPAFDPAKTLYNAEYQQFRKQSFRSVVEGQPLTVSDDRLERIVGRADLGRSSASADPGAGPAAISHTGVGRMWVAGALVLGDILTLEACVLAAFLLRQALIDIFPIGLAPVNVIGVALGVLVLPVVFALMGLYPGYGADGAERLRKRVVSTAAIFCTLIGWDYFVQDGLWSRGILIATWILATISLPVTTASIISSLVRWNCWGTPVLVMGPPTAARATVENLKAVPRIGFVPVGYVSSHEDSISDDRDRVGVPWLGSIRTVNDLAPIAKTVMIVNPASYGDRLAKVVAGLAFPHVILVPEFTGMQSLWVTTRDLGGTNGLEIKKNLLVPHNRVIKRGLDLLLSAPLFLFSLPLLAFLCLAIMAVSPGSPFFAQVREGEGGRRFRMLKLRTMHRDAEARLKAHLDSSAIARGEWSQHYKLRDDPRILPVIGKFLRKSSLDELPQLWHILRGQMSLVGPRPFPHYHLEGFNPEFRTLRRSVRPGLTGLWQVEARSDGDLMVQEKLDTFYIRNWSLWLDIHILMRTFVAVVRGGGAR